MSFLAPKRGKNGIDCGHIIDVATCESVNNEVHGEGHYLRPYDKCRSMQVHEQKYSQEECIVNGHAMRLQRVKLATALVVEILS